MAIRTLWRFLGAVGLLLSACDPMPDPFDCSPCLYVANQASDDVTVINAATKTVVHHIPAGRTPQFLAVSPNEARVYVSAHSGARAGLVTVIDTATYAIEATIPVGDNPTGLAVNPAGTRLYVLNSGDDTMSVIDTASDTVIDTVEVAPLPYDVVIAPEGDRLYISSERAGEVQVLDAASLTQIGARVPVGSTAAGLAINASGSRVYAADFRAGAVTVIDTASQTAIATISAGRGAIALALDPAGDRLYSANFGNGAGDTVSVMSAASNTTVDTIGVGTSPHGVVVDPAGTTLYTANQVTNDVSAVGLSTNATDSLPVGARPTGIALVHATGTTPPISAIHYVSAVNGIPRYEPETITDADHDDVLTFTVRLPGVAPGTPADLHYYLNPNLRLIAATSGEWTGPVCTAVPTTLDLPNGMHGDTQRLDCALADGSLPLIVHAKVTGVRPPRDDPFAAAACLSSPSSEYHPVRVAVRAPPGAVSSIGPQRTAIILVSDSTAPPHPFADKAMTASLFYSAANPGSARSFFDQASYGLMAITGADPTTEGGTTDIYGPYSEVTNDCSFTPLPLADPDIDYRRYERIVIITNSAACGGGGVSSSSPRNFDTGDGTVALTLSTVHGLSFGETVLNGRIGNTTLHEYGHNLGLAHASSWDCGNEVLAANNCVADAYVEPVNLVNQGGEDRQPHGVAKERLGWVEGKRVLPVWRSGTYALTAFEEGSDNTKVLKIPRKLAASGAATGPSYGYYYVSYRKPQPPWDAAIVSGTNSSTGLTIHLDESGRLYKKGALLDMAPGSTSAVSDIRDGALLPGQTFTDPLTGVAITLNALTATEATVAVDIPPRGSNFTLVGKELLTIARVDAATVGTVSGGGNALVGQPVTLSATALPGWGFAGWWEYLPDAPARQASPATPYTFFATNDRVLWARFRPASPPNDDFADAETIATLPETFTLFTAGASRETGEPLPAEQCGGGIGRGATVWYSYTPATDQDININMAGSFNAVDITVYTGSALNALTPVPGTCALWTGSSIDLTFAAQAGETYHFQMDTAGGNSVFSFSAP